VCLSCSCAHWVGDVSSHIIDTREEEASVIMLLVLLLSRAQEQPAARGLYHVLA
jgi:hypothetical protein